MRISDYDRQEFAQALRELADGNGGELLGHVNCLRVDEVGDYTLFGVGAVLAMDKAGSCDAEDASGYLAALADLIDRPTCEMGGNLSTRYAICSRCGAFVRRDAVTDCCGVIPVRFCANCGAEVKDEMD